MSTKHTHIGHLTVSQSDALPPQAMLLGYSLRLSPSEAVILSAILEAETRKALTARDLASLLSPDEPVSENQVSVLIGRINRKAYAISGRKLILGVSHRGYRIHPYM